MHKKHVVFILCLSLITTRTFVVKIKVLFQYKKKNYFCRYFYAAVIYLWKYLRYFKLTSSFSLIDMFKFYLQYRLWTKDCLQTITPHKDLAQKGWLIKAHIHIHMILFHGGRIKYMQPVYFKNDLWTKYIRNSRSL